MKRGPILAAIVVAVVAILTVVALILPKAAAVRSKRAEVEDARQQQSSLELTVRQLQADRDEAPQNRKQLEQLQAQVPSTVDLPGLIRLLNRSAGFSAVDFITLQPGQPAPGASGITVIPFTINVTGSFFSVDEYLVRLEQLPRIARVISISINGGSQEATPQLQVTLSAEFYTTDTSAGPGSVPGPSDAGAAQPPAPAPAPSASPEPTPSSPFSPSPSPSPTA